MEWILTHLSFRSAYVWIGFICSSSDSDSSKLTLLLNGWETWPTRSWSALFTFTMDWHWRSDADRSIVVWPRLSLSVCVLVLMYCFGTRPYSFSDLNQKTRKLYQFYCFTDPSLNWQPPLQSSHTWLSYARFRASGPVPPVADYCWKTYSLKLERDLARFREKLDVQRTGRFFFLVETFDQMGAANVLDCFYQKRTAHLRHESWQRPRYWCCFISCPRGHQESQRPMMDPSYRHFDPYRQACCRTCSRTSTDLQGPEATSPSMR